MENFFVLVINWDLEEAAVYNVLGRMQNGWTKLRDLLP